jgi:hypothetical protein
MDYTISKRRPLDQEPLLAPTAVDGAVAAAPALAAAEEDLVADVRASLTPAQMVERKLVSLLKSNPMPVSHLMTGKASLRDR